MKTPPESELPEASPDGEGPPGAEVSVKRIQAINLCLLGATCLASLWISREFALGVLAGGLIMAANFGIIAAVIRSVFLKGETSALKVGFYWLKFAGILGIVGVLILVFRIEVTGLLLGLSTILVAVTAEAVLRMAGR